MWIQATSLIFIFLIFRERLVVLSYFLFHSNNNGSKGFLACCLTHSSSSICTAFLQIVPESGMWNIWLFLQPSNWCRKSSNSLTSKFVYMYFSIIEYLFYL